MNLHEGKKKEKDSFLDGPEWGVGGESANVGLVQREKERRGLCCFLGGEGCRKSSSLTHREGKKGSNLCRFFTKKSSCQKPAGGEKKQSKIGV